MSTVAGGFYLLLLVLNLIASWISWSKRNQDKININGGAIALGHPLGCTGSKLTTTLLHALAERKLKYGMVTMCIGGGMGAAGVFERM